MMAVRMAIPSSQPFSLLGSVTANVPPIVYTESHDQRCREIAAHVSKRDAGRPANAHMLAMKLHPVVSGNSITLDFMRRVGE